MLDKNRFRAAIALAGLTQNELAAKMGISKNTLSNKVTGRNHITLKDVECICNILGVDDEGERAKIFMAKEVTS